MWKSRALVLGAISKRGGKGGKVPVSLRRLSWPWAGLFHAFHGASFPQRLPTTPFLDAPRRGTERFCGGFWAHSCRSEEHTSELQSRLHLVCRLLLEKKKKNKSKTTSLRLD